MLRLGFGVRTLASSQSQLFHFISIGRRSSNVIRAEHSMGWGVAAPLLGLAVLVRKLPARRGTRGGAV